MCHVGERFASSNVKLQFGIKSDVSEKGLMVPHEENDAARSRGWVFTLNNYSEAEEADVQARAVEDSVRYIVYGREIGDSGTPHLQGYVEWRTVRSLRRVREFNSRAHWERRRGTPIQAREYCVKDGNFWEWGELPAQGRRTDLEAIRARLDEGAGSLEIARHYFGDWCRYGKAFEQYQMLVAAQEMREVEVEVLWGCTGGGKTYTAIQRSLERGGGYFILVQGNGGLWFPGYAGEQNLIIDDFDGSWIRFRSLLRILDKYPLKVEDKGKHVVARWLHVTITSNIDPMLWYTEEDYRPLQRRISSVERFTEAYSDQ